MGPPITQVAIKHSQEYPIQSPRTIRIFHQHPLQIFLSKKPPNHYPLLRSRESLLLTSGLHITLFVKSIPSHISAFTPPHDSISWPRWNRTWPNQPRCQVWAQGGGTTEFETQAALISDRQKFKYRSASELARTVERIINSGTSDEYFLYFHGVVNPKFDVIDWELRRLRYACHLRMY